MTGTASNFVNVINKFEVLGTSKGPLDIKLLSASERISEYNKDQKEKTTLKKVKSMPLPFSYRAENHKVVTYFFK